ncbi:MAG TPA: Xaa-Pro peptidase family protein [Ktedonobacterales bacterium]|nr:Xaa-Pro peptidase family protein [Ktedonobacterales bacterium]
MDSQRAAWVAERMRQRGYTALICRLPEHVVMLTGFQPILGNTFVILSLTDSGALECRVALPKAEEDRFPRDGVAEVQTYEEETMRRISTTLPSVRQPLAELLAAAGLASSLPSRGRARERSTVVGYESDLPTVAVAYTQIGFPGPGTRDLLHELLPDVELRDSTDDLNTLAARKTSAELIWIQKAEAAGREGFLAARAAIHIGATEVEVAATTTAALLRAGYAMPGASHVLAFAHVMAGARAAYAHKAYNLTSSYVIQRGDTVLVQLEVSINGYWAELTRTFFAGELLPEWRKAHEACVAAQDAAVRVIRDGVPARAADAAARRIMTDAGLGDAFKHGLGHGFGFQAINHAAQPILHPASSDMLRADMIHNLEPAVYLDGKGGVRLNDDVHVRVDSNEVLSAGIPRDLDWLVVT